LRPSEDGVAAGQLWCAGEKSYSDFVRFTQICSDQKILFGGKKRGKAGKSGKLWEVYRKDGWQRAEASGGGKRWKNMEERGKGAMSCGVTSG